MHQTPVPRRRVVLASGRLALLGLASALGASSLVACAPKESTTAAQAPSSGVSVDEALNLARSAHGFTVGTVMAANTVVVFFDTTCPHCAHLWQAAQPLLGQLKMVWIPIGLLRPQSGPQGAAILGAADPVAAMKENEASVIAGGAGISAGASPDPVVLEKVQANTELFKRLGADSVPLLLFRNAKTGVAGRQEGALQTAELAALVGL